MVQWLEGEEQDWFFWNPWGPKVDPLYLGTMSNSYENWIFLGAEKHRRETFLRRRRRRKGCKTSR